LSSPPGQLLLPHAKRILADAERAEAELRAYLGLEAGQLHIGLIQTVVSASDILHPISRFHERFPAIEDRAVEVLTLIADRGQHRAPSVPDLIIAATAELAGLTVLHFDKDFDLVAGITGQPVEWPNAA
jgi:DNA-binding transcriptional LysR family regulator